MYSNKSTMDEFDKFLARMMEFENNRERLLANRKMIRKKIGQCLKNNEFTKKGKSIYYKFQKDLIVYFVIEHPPGNFYINHCIYPMFMRPMDYMTLDFGNRVSTVIGDYRLNISDYSTEDETIDLCTKIDLFIKEIFMPFICTIETVETFNHFLNEKKTDQVKDIVHISNVDKTKLQMYTELSMQQYSNAKKTAKKYKKEIDSYKGRRSEEYINDANEDYNEVMRLALSKDEKYIEETIEGWRLMNKEFFSRNKSVNKTQPQRTENMQEKEK